MASTHTQMSFGGNLAMAILTLAGIAIVAFAALYMMTDHRSSGERLGDAVEALPQGVDKAANQFDDQAPAKNVERNTEDAVN
jgi:hypothetical protein